MKKLICVISMVLALAAVVCAPEPVQASGEGGSVTGAGRGTLADTTWFGSVQLSGMDIGTGVFIEPDGSATGQFTALLTGISVLGQAQQIVVEGTVLQGGLSSAGEASFSGVAGVSFGNGLPSLSGVPFRVTTTGDSLTLTLDSRTLPVARLSAGSITIE